MKKSQTVLAIVIILLMCGLSWFLFTRETGTPHSVETKSIAREFAVIETAETSAVDSGIYDGRAFNDGLQNPTLVERFELDEYGEGIALVESYTVETGGKNLTITKSRHENGTDHFHYEYQILLDNSTDITPKGFRTVESADCSLQKFRFVFLPFFQVIKISRGWEESWVNPTMAYKTIYHFENDQLRPESSVPLRKICNIAELF